MRFDPEWEKEGTEGGDGAKAEQSQKPLEEEKRKQSKEKDQYPLIHP